MEGCAVDMHSISEQAVRHVPMQCVLLGIPVQCMAMVNIQACAAACSIECIDDIMGCQWWTASPFIKLSDSD